MFRNGLKVALLVVLLTSAQQVAGAPTDFDPTFGVGGKAIVDFGPPPSGQVWTSGIDRQILLSNGVIVVAGDVRSTYSDTVASVGGKFVARILPDGRPDPSFGGDGVIILQPGDEALFNINGLAVQSDGKYLITGIAEYPTPNDSSYFLTRLREDGAVDTGFGNSGIIYIPDPEGSYSSGTAVIETKSGQIATAGFQYHSPDGNRAMTVMCFNQNGTLDPSFGSNGILFISFDAANGYPSAFATSLLERDNGSFVVGGGAEVATSEGGNTGEFAIAEIDATGKLNESFNGTGKVLLRTTEDDSLVNGMLLRGDGSVVAVGAGIDYDGTGYGVAVKLRPDGSLDSTFGAGTGVVKTHAANPGRAYSLPGADAIAEQANGKLIVAGRASGATGAFFNQSRLVRYLPNGQADPSFGDRGIMDAVLGVEDGVSAVALQPDGKILIAGIDGGAQAVVARLMGNTVAPVELEARPGNAQVTLSWTAAAGATNYNIYQGTTENGESMTPVRAGVTGANVIIDGLINGTTYYFKVAAVGAAGISDLSEDISATPLLPIPVAPSGLTASAGTQQISLNWTAVGDATSYNIYQGTTTGGESETPIRTGVTENSVVITGLSAGVVYYFKVAAVNASGVGDLSAEVNATPLPPLPAAPSGLTASAGSQQVSLSWAVVSDATSYNIYQGTSAGGEATTPVRTGVSGANVVISGLAAGATYYFKVAAVNAAGQGPLSNEASVALAATNDGGGGGLVSPFLLVMLAGMALMRRQRKR